MNTSRLHAAGPRLLAGFGTAALLTGLGLAASRPVHSAGGPIAVNVANTPLPTTAADNHDKQPVQYTANILIGRYDILRDDYGYTVPAGKRLVIENVSAVGYVPDYHYSISCVTYGGPSKSFALSSFNILPNGSDEPAGSIQTHQYAEAGDNVILQAERKEYDGVDAPVAVSFFGYLVDTP